MRDPPPPPPPCTVLGCSVRTPEPHTALWRGDSRSPALPWLQCKWKAWHTLLSSASCRLFHIIWSCKGEKNHIFTSSGILCPYLKLAQFLRCYFRKCRPTITLQTYWLNQPYATEMVECVCVCVFSPWVTSNSLQPLGLHHTRLLCPHCLLEFAQIHVHQFKMLSNLLIPCHPLVLLPSVFPSIRVFSNEVQPKPEAARLLVLLHLPTQLASMWLLGAEVSRKDSWDKEMKLWLREGRWCLRPESPEECEMGILGKRESAQEDLVRKEEMKEKAGEEAGKEVFYV